MPPVNADLDFAMTSLPHALLPSGFYDLLFPEADFEAHLQHVTMTCLESYGYQRVKPPLVEFEESLLLESGSKMDKDTFRLMDPQSQRLMGLRTDITMQIGRIALSRLKRLPRPLRLCYSGTTLTTRASALQPSRQHMQAGAELIGTDSPSADVEAIAVAVNALQRMGVKRLSVDLTLPSLVPSLLEEDPELPLEARKEIAAGLAQKDIGPLSAYKTRYGDTLRRLADASGPAENVLAVLDTLTLPQDEAILCAQARETVQRVSEACPDVRITMDATENRGFDYHTGVSFAFFAAGIEGEIGRGGRYRVAFDGQTPATGFTLYISRLLPILKAPPSAPRVYVPAGVPFSTLAKLHDKGGYVTVQGLETESAEWNDTTLAKEAARLSCTHYFWEEKVHAI